MRSPTGLTGRLDGVAPEVRNVARVAAVLGKTLRFDDLAAVLGLSPTQLMPPVAELVSRGVLLDGDGVLHLRDDLLRETLLAEIPHAALHAVRREAARVLLRAGVSPLAAAARLRSRAQTDDQDAISALSDAAGALGPTGSATTGHRLGQARTSARQHDPRRPRVVAEAAVLLHDGGLGYVLSLEVGAEVRLVRLARESGDDELARAAVGQAQERARHNPGVASIAGAAAHARGLYHDDAAELAVAVDLLAQGDRPLLLASALEDLGRVQALAGDRDAAPAQDAGWASLSASEELVARLIGEGHTNRQAAERLHISPHTVNTLLRRVFGKLDIHSRVELARIVTHRG